jgi:hypothetical protein
MHQSLDLKIENHNTLVSQLQTSGLTLAQRENLHSRISAVGAPVTNPNALPTTPRPALLLTPSSLITNHIATASSSQHAHRATILAAQAHVTRRDSTSFGFDSLLAKALRYGKVVRFANEDEKLRAVALAQEQADQAALRMSAQKSKPITAGKIEFQAAPKKYREELVGRVARGHYAEQSKEKGAVGLVGQRLTVNETFARKSGREFLGILKRLMPQATSGKS